ncbi:tRNA glutamyl-Q(34) synthetase GluQRS [uncultured Paraglaciecola sp.]|uniref:tRNA glutamyl-Q(34) synthetase GluQRS n=1 Tax=uncultured Paraglaciecola sp. TaxID=1765024 RepID=UPI002626216E|nr:tRNA glutamyl-Q(34) synthetase GluQRS [uncultured Paraglaciecola sp.]
MATALHSPSTNRLTPNKGYVGRFAPSPSGHLHFGSLVTALGSFLQAKSQNGQWLLRIEDIDPPREVAGATDSILNCLEAHHLFWDGEVIYQSDRSELYNQKIQYLASQGLTYHCRCTRKQLAIVPQNQLCDCADQNLSIANSAIRFKHHDVQKGFNDNLLGRVNFNTQHIPAQFAIKRKDQLFAYQLAVVVDDIQQGITEVARGADLIDATLFQLALYQAFDTPAPQFLHFPVVVTAPGKKLSKQNHAVPVNNLEARENLINAIEFLGLSPSIQLKKGSVADILEWAIQVWNVNAVAAKTECIDNRIGQSDSI